MSNESSSNTQSAYDAGYKAGETLRKMMAEQVKPIEYLRDFSRNDAGCKLVAAVAYLLLKNKDEAVRTEAAEILEAWVLECSTEKGIEEIASGFSGHETAALIAAMVQADRPTEEAEPNSELITFFEGLSDREKFTCYLYEKMRYILQMEKGPNNADKLFDICADFDESKLDMPKAERWLGMVDMSQYVSV